MGLQTLDRAAAALRELSRADAEGVRLVDLQHRLGLTKPTAHRLLASLLEHGLASQDEVTKRYYLGPALATLARVAPRLNDDVRRLCLPALERLARRSGYAAILLIRFGLETFCAARAGGDAVAQRATQVGLLRPLGVGAGGMAILGELDEADAQRVLRQVRPRIRTLTRHADRDLESELQVARRSGFAVTHGTLIPGMSGIGLSLRDADGQAVGSIGMLLPQHAALGRDGHRVIELGQREREQAERALATIRPAGGSWRTPRDASLIHRCAR